MEERMYVMYNKEYGGFSFSKKFCKELEKRLNITIDSLDESYRDNQEACKLLLEKGSKWCNGGCSNLQLVSIPKCMADTYEVEEHDGYETIYILKGVAIANETRSYIKNPTAEALEKLKNFIDMVDNATIEEVKIPK